MSHFVITGANRGIGLELARQAQQSGHQVTALCRKASEELKNLDVKTIENVDVTDFQSLSNVGQELQSQSIDCLINNAGVMRPGALDQVGPEDMELQFRTNTMAPLFLTRSLLGLIPQGGRVAIITSRMGSIEDNSSGGSYGYRASKAAVNAIGKSLALDLKEKGIAVALLHPGWVQTDMTQYSGHLTPEQAASKIHQRLVELNLENSGTFWHSNGEILPW